MFSNVSEVDWENWIFTEEAVLTFVQNEDKVLLINKKRGLGHGKVNAPGGRIDRGEKPEEAAIRECIEEVGIEPLNLAYVGELNFIFTDGYSLKGYVYFSDKYKGEMIETDEADPFWCDIDKIPYERMWSDDKEWLPIVLRKETFEGHFIFEDDKMLSFTVNSVGKWEYPES